MGWEKCLYGAGELVLKGFKKTSRPHSVWRAIHLNLARCLNYSISRNCPAPTRCDSRWIIFGAPKRKRRRNCQNKKTTLNMLAATRIVPLQPPLEHLCFTSTQQIYQSNEAICFLPPPPRLPIGNGAVRQAGEACPIGVDDVDFVVAITKGSEGNPVPIR